RTKGLPMTHSPASQQYREKQAGDLQPGDFVFLPGDGPAEEIAAVEVEKDDYGVAALLVVTTLDGGTVRIAAGSSVPVGDGASAGLAAPESAAVGLAGSEADGSSTSMEGEAEVEGGSAGRPSPPPGNPACSRHAGPRRTRADPRAGRNA